jgi:hypothetical protein
VAEEQVEGVDDGVVYVGRTGIKMKAGVGMTPAAGTPAAPGATMPPVPPPSGAPLPPLRRVSGAYRPVPEAITNRSAGGGGATRTLVIGGLCMIAFSCGVMCTIAVDRFWPRARAQCVGAQAPTTGVAPEPQGGPVIETMRAPAASPVPIGTAAAARSGPEESTAAAETAPPAVTPPTAPTPQAGAAPAAPPARAARAATPARGQPTQGRGGGRKRPGGATPMSLDTMSPTGMWVDPFAE